MRIRPPGEDGTNGVRGLAVPVSAMATPPGEDGLNRAEMAADQIENVAQQLAESAGEGFDDPSIDFLGLIDRAESQARTYAEQANRKAWTQNYRAFHNEHFVGSKYTKPEYRGRSRLFVPKTRTAVRKDMAAVAASLFNNIDAINCIPGNEGDPRNRAAAAVMEELVNYRTDRTSGKAAFPWFLISMGARQDALLTGICLSKQSWKQEFRKVGVEMFRDPATGEVRQREVYEQTVDRPDMQLVPPENLIIDPAAEWTNPAQSAAYLIIKWPMQIEEVKAMQNAPVNPWNPNITEAELQSASTSQFDMEAVRRAREMGLDRLDETQTGTKFKIVWVYETFMRLDGDDYTFFSVGSQHYLTEPRPVREVYPEQFGERPLALGYGSLESHRISPMSPVESWQPLQLETNDLRNLLLDATKQNVMPISKVRRGRQIDLDQVRRRSSGSSIMVQNPDDVTWETPPQIGQAPILMARELDLELDDLSGQQNFGSVETNNALGKTLGGLKLAAGAANAVQEFDIRVWIETWATPALAQIVRLEQYYETDATVLGLCGTRAQLFEKYGVNQIDNEFMEQEITVRVSVGLGAGDPQQRLAKFQSAASIVAPIVAQSPEFQSGQREVNVDAIIEEVFGAAGYKDGGERFFKNNGQPRANPMGDLKAQELRAKIAKDNRTGQAAFFQGLAALAKVALGKRELEAETVDMMLGHQREAHRMGFEHGHRQNEQHLAAMDHGHRHGLALANHRRDLANDEHARAQAMQQAEQQAMAAQQGAGSEPEGMPPEGGQPSQQGGQPQQPPAPQGPDIMQLLRSGQLQFVRDPQTGRIAGMRLAPQGGPQGVA